MKVRIIIFIFYCFIFQPLFTLNTILHWFQIYSKVAGKPWSLQSGPPPSPFCSPLAAPGTHLAPYPVISTLLTIFPTLQSESLWLFFNYQFVLFNPFISFTLFSTLAHGGSLLSCSEKPLGEHWYLCTRPHWCSSQNSKYLLGDVKNFGLVWNWQVSWTEDGGALAAYMANCG